MTKAFVRAEGFEGGGAVRDGPGVAPDDGVPKKAASFVDTDKAVHLVGYSYRGDGQFPFGERSRTTALGPDLGEHIGRGELEVLPPVLRILLRPTGFQ